MPANGQFCVGVCFGILLFLGSIFLLGWNEFNYVRNQAILLKVDKEVIEAGCVPSASNVGKPIWASCVVQRGYDFTTDPQVQSMGLSFSGEVRGAWFKADSTILQWTEDKSCSSHSTGGGGREKDCTYDYNLEWVSSPQSSSNFYCYPSWRPGCQRSGSQIQNSGTIPTSLQQTLNAPDGTVGMGSSTDSLYFLDNKEMGVFPSVPVTVPSGQRTSLLPNKQLVQVDTEAVQFGPRTELHWRRPDHLHPVPGPVWPDAGSHHRQAGCHVKQQCSDETLGHPVAWYHVLGRLGLNGWLIQIGHDQREAK